MRYEEGYPSIPGKPETYSPTYNKYLDMLRKNMRGESLTQEEAGEVYDYMNQLVHYTVPEGGALLLLYEQLAIERSQGLRCSVCGKVQDPDCIEGC